MVTKANPNVVPLCDILLVLLIIFMVISPMAQAGVDVRLPETGPINKGRPIVLTIEKEDLITVNQQEFNDLEILGEWLAKLYRSKQEKTIFVRAHNDVLYKYVVKIIDMIKGAGVDNVCVMPYRN